MRVLDEGQIIFLELEQVEDSGHLLWHGRAVEVVVVPG